MIKETHKSTTNVIIHDHHVIKSSRILILNKLSSTEIYAILISKIQNKLSSNFSFEICVIKMILIGQQFICYHA